MFYHWLAPLGKQYIIFNLFNYISFRAAGATVTALLLAFVLGPSARITCPTFFSRSRRITEGPRTNASSNAVTVAPAARKLM